jgi:hypothetical protein
MVSHAGQWSVPWIDLHLRKESNEIGKNMRKCGAKEHLGMTRPAANWLALLDVTEVQHPCELGLSSGISRPDAVRYTRPVCIEARYDAFGAPVLQAVRSNETKA